MGVNLFVEGSPAPVVITVTLPRDVTQFSDVQQVASALAMVDREVSSLWTKCWPSMKSRRRREVRLLRFQVSSPHVFQILADPAWLAVFLAVLTFYKPAKESAIELSEDFRAGAREISGLLNRIRGLTERQLQLLGIAVQLTAERLLQQGEEASLKMASRFARARKQLLGDTEEDPDINVDDIDNKHRPW
jgi:hypothetical protein